jgi:hypothetical protein
MFVHAGASLHGHDLSPPTANHHHHHHHPPTRPIPLLRSALRPLSEISEPTYSEVPTTAARRSLTESDLTRPVCTQCRRTQSDITVQRRDLSVRFREPHMAPLSPSGALILSDDEESVADSDFTTSTAVAGSITSSSGRKRRKTPRRSTRYALATPAPQLLTKQRLLVQIRPRLLLQLQKLGDHRPTPAYDIVPSSIISGSIIIPKLAKTLPRLFGTNSELGQDDLLIIRSEDYSQEKCEEAASGHAVFDNRDLLAVISPLPQMGDDCSEIIMDDGTVWTSRRLANGSYEFNTVDSLGNTSTARWVKRSLRQSVTAETLDGSSASSPLPAEYKWTFSMIDPSTRRHPIMGVILRNELEMFDTYTTLSSSSGRFPPTKPFNLPTTITEPGSLSATGKEVRQTELVFERHKKLMIATASWISLRSQGWPAALNPKMRRSNSCRRVNSGKKAERRRTFPFADGPPPPPATATVKPVQSQPEKDTVPMTSVLSDIGTPRRSMSTGAAYMRRRLSMDHPTDSSTSLDHEKRTSERACPPNLLATEEKTHTCRIKVLKLTRRLFQRKDCHTD